MTNESAYSPVHDPENLEAVELNYVWWQFAILLSCKHDDKVACFNVSNAYEKARRRLLNSIGISMLMGLDVRRTRWQMSEEVELNPRKID